MLNCTFEGHKNFLKKTTQFQNDKTQSSTFIIKIFQELYSIDQDTENRLFSILNFFKIFDQKKDFWIKSESEEMKLMLNSLRNKI